MGYRSVASLSATANPPGFSPEVLATALFLEAGNSLFPYTLVEDRFVPFVLVHEASGLYFYPVFVSVDGILVPVFHVKPILLPTIPVVLPVLVPPVLANVAARPTLRQEVPPEFIQERLAQRAEAEGRLPEGMRERLQEQVRSQAEATLQREEVSKVREKAQARIREARERLERLRRTRPRQ